MGTDRLTKVLWAVIALGLWANVMTSWLRPIPVFAQTSMTLESIDVSVRSINSNLAALTIGGPACSNKKICD
jgi:hypothetical protein